MCISIEYDSLTVGIIIMALLSAIFIGCWILKHFNRVANSAKSKENEAKHAEQFKVSVIIYSCYGCNMLKETLPLILSQDYDNYDVIVVDDNYEECTKDYLTDMMLKNKNLYFTNIPQGTLNLSRKKLALTLGIKAAQSEYVLLTESNCKVQSQKWISLMMQKCEPGVDIVIGNTSHIEETQNSVIKSYLNFDQIVAKVCYLSYALNGAAYRADCCNMVLRRNLFFEVKGFSATMNLHAGEDDLFIAQVAKNHSTKVQLAKDSQLLSYGTATSRALREYKLQHLFTGKGLHTFSKISVAMYLLFYWVLVFSIISGAVIYPMNIALWIFNFVVLLSVWITQIYAFDRAARVLCHKPFSFRIPFYTMVAPVYNAWYRIIGYKSRKSNYTYQRKRQK
ncbi:MAG: glycosyltransferase [Muribaculaceae bacterium]|nr:glycosyltransferase [Muribaculaceae bacterium]